MFFINHVEIENSSTALIEIDGPLNSETSSDFEEYLSKLCDNGIIYLVINSAKLNFISSEGIGAVMLLHRKISAINGAAVFFNLSREISLLFHLLGFDNIIDIAPDREAAIELAKQRGSGSAGSGDSINDSPSREARGRPSAERYKKPVEASPGNNSTGLHTNNSAINPFVIECVKCSSPVRVTMKGDFYCPYCSAPFTVSGDGNAIFRINNIPAADS